MNLKKQLMRVGVAIGLAFIAGTAAAQTPITVTTNFVVSRLIPDNSGSGMSDTRNLSLGSQNLFSITDLQVTLQISGGFNGDIYGYVEHNGVIAVLLNRSGRTSGNDAGYGDSGFNITLSGSALYDVHNYRDITGAVSPLTGTWAPDGRFIDPAIALDTDPRTALLSSFNDGDPSGDWTLFLADLDFGGQATLQSWGLIITAVPEPSTWALGLLGLSGLWLVRRKLRHT